MIVLSAVCTSLWGCLSNCWPLVLAAFVVGSWFGLMILSLLIGASRRTTPVIGATCPKCRAHWAELEGRA
jgi:hypothetical protein